MAGKEPFVETLTGRYLRTAGAWRRRHGGGDHRLVLRPHRQLRDPRHVFFVGELPVTSSGEIPKTKLRAQGAKDPPLAGDDALGRDAATREPRAVSGAWRVH